MRGGGSMRAMIDQDIPLNAGCLVPLTSTSLSPPLLRLFSLTSLGAVIIPQDTLLTPSPEAAVCAGNVLTSQRITDVCLKAFNACAASQGCCNKYVFFRLPRLMGLC
jgi:5-oxoprolinase (ATP-hydrolysing)